MPRIHLSVPPTVWTADLVKTLRRLWGEGRPASAIGRELGVSKNSVIGKVHRLGLTPRPSPLKSPPRRVVHHASGPVMACQWPIPSPVNPGRHVSCAKATLPGKPYCAEHAARAYRAPEARS